MNTLLTLTETKNTILQIYKTTDNGPSSKQTNNYNYNYIIIIIILVLI